MAAAITTLTTYLSTIQTVKSQIDGVLSYATGGRTPFSQYPTYIAAAIEGGGVRHDGLSAENAYTVAEAISRFSSASQDDFIYGSWLSDDVTYVTGIISKINEISTQYHNCTFTISDDGTYEMSSIYVDGADNLLLYRQGMEAGVWNMPSDTAPKVGDKIIVYGKWTGTTDFVINEGFSTYWDNGANAYCGVSSLYREAPSGGYTVTQNGSELDLSSYSYVTVNVAGGGSGPDPNLRNLSYVECNIHDDKTDADYVAYLPQSYSYFTIGGGMRHYFESVTDPETEEEIGEYIDDNYFNIDVDDGKGSTTGMECYTGGFQPRGRIADEVQDDGNGGTEPRYRGIRIDMPEQYLGDMLNYMYWDEDNDHWGTIPASGTWAVHAEFDESNPGFYFANANMGDFSGNDWSFDYTVKIPNNFYYYGNCDVYIDWTFNGQLNTDEEEPVEE